MVSVPNQIYYKLNQYKSKKPNKIQTVLIVLNVSIIFSVVLVFCLNKLLFNDEENINNKPMRTESNKYVSLKSVAPAKKCPQVPPNLNGKVKVSKEDITLKELEMRLPDVKTGGRHSPNCITDERVAIIIPVQKQDMHLRILLRNLHPFLIRQQRDYRIYVVEQKQKDKFNKGKLFNVGFIYAYKDGYNCFIFHDVNWIPEEYSNVYQCGSQPVQLSAESVAITDHTSKHDTQFGGVVALKYDQFKQLNGYSNKCQNGGEDDDIFTRIKASKMTVIRKPSKVGRFVVMDQTQVRTQTKTAPMDLFKDLKRGINAVVYPMFELHLNDGLSDIEYEIIDFNEYKLYTRILTEG